MEGAVVSGDEREKDPMIEISKELRRNDDEAIGDFGLRKRRVASKEHLAVTQTSSGQGISTAASRLLQEDDRGQPMKMKRKRKHGMFTPKRRSTSEAPMKTMKPDEAKKEIDQDVLGKKGFVTADVHKGDDAAYIVYAMRDFVLYLIYLQSVFVITIGSQSSSHNYYSQMVDELLTGSDFRTPVGQTEYPGIVDNFHGIKTPQQLWTFITDVLLKFIYDDPDPLNVGNTVLMESVLVGVPSISQLRVKKNTCETAPMFEDLYKTCYDYYSLDIKDKSNLDRLTGEKQPYNSSYPWEYFPETILKKKIFLFKGVMGSYRGGGLKFNFTSSHSMTRSWLNELKNNNWIRIGTRYVAVDFTLYTPNTNLFLVVKLAFELIPAGGIIAHSVFSTLKMFRYSTLSDLFVLSAEIVFIGFTVYFTFEEGQQMYILKEEYLSNGWNILDIVIIVLSYLTIGLGVYRIIVVEISLREELLYIRSNSVSNIDNVKYTQELFNELLSMLLFIAWMKLFKFSTLSKSIVSILSVFHRVGEKLLTVTCMALILTTGYAVCGHVLFGYSVHEFQDFRRSLSTMMSTYIGRLGYYKRCQRYYPVIAPVFFSTYILGMVVIYCNMFVALLVLGFERVKMFMNEDPDNLYLDDWVYSVVLHFLTLLKQHHLVTKLILKNLVGRMNRDYIELMRILDRHGFHSLERKLLLERYEIWKGADLNLENVSELYNDVCTRNQLVNEVEDHNELQKVMNHIQRLIDHCDQTILDVMNKTEILSDMMARKIEEKPNVPKRGKRKK